MYKFLHQVFVHKLIILLRELIELLRQDGDFPGLPLVEKNRVTLFINGK